MVRQVKQQVNDLEKFRSTPIKHSTPAYLFDQLS